MQRAAWFLGAPIRAVLIGMILAYRGTLGRVLAGRCRFHPSCSAYALDSIRTHGALKGLALSGWRIARCSPLTSGGLDPVPAPGMWHSRSAV